MISSLQRIIVMARNTLTEAVRQKVLNVLLIFGLVLVASSVGFSKLATPGLDAAGLFSEQIKFVKDFGCGAIGLFGFFIALLSTAQLIPQELHNRTIYTILSKPVRRAEFLLGKFFGIVLLLALCVALMSLAFAAALYWQEWRGVYAADAMYPNWQNNPVLAGMYQSDVLQIKDQVRDPQLVQAVLLLFAKLVMTSALAMLISSFATSSIFTIITTIMIYLIGHMEGTAREFWFARGAETTFWQSALLSFIALLIPDLNSFTIVDEILSGNHVHWADTCNLLGYAGIYVVVLLAVSIVFFDYREI